MLQPHFLFESPPIAGTERDCFPFSGTEGITHIKQWIPPLISAFLTPAPWVAA